MDRETLAAYVDQRLTLRQMGELLGRDPSTVSYWLNKYGMSAIHRDKFAPKGGLSRDALEPLVEEGLTQREIAARLDRSVSTVRYWLAKHGLETEGTAWWGAPERRAERNLERPRFVERRCRTHGRTTYILISSGGYVCRQCRIDRVAKWRRRLKERLVAEAGGRCASCGYDQHMGALHFHHLDPKTKAFGISRGGSTRSIEEAREEARKCVLLCSNCHAEVEGGVRGLAGIDSGYSCQGTVPGGR